MPFATCRCQRLRLGLGCVGKTRTALVRCQSCRLLYRTPRDILDGNEAFYQDDYRSGGLTAILPSQQDLAWLLEARFKASDKNFTGKIGVLRALGVPDGARVLDFGASWGYATLQLCWAGYDACGFEISSPRAKYGQRNLGVEIATKESQLSGHFDVFFSSHVIEHFSNPRKALAFAKRQLRKQGVFIAFTPNGSEMRMQLDRGSYNHSWGRLHPVYIDESFYHHNLPSTPKLFTSRQYGAWNDLSDIWSWDRKSDKIGNLALPELLAIWVNNGE